MKTGAEYSTQLEQMAHNAQAWLAANAGTLNGEDRPTIGFIFPTRTCIIGTITDAITAGYVKTNARGLEFLKAIWPPWDSDSREPTVMMMRAVVETVFERHTKP